MTKFIPFIFTLFLFAACQTEPTSTEPSREQQMIEVFRQRVADDLLTEGLVLDTVLQVVVSDDQRPRYMDLTADVSAKDSLGVFRRYLMTYDCLQRVDVSRNIHFRNITVTGE